MEVLWINALVVFAAFFAVVGESGADRRHAMGGVFARPGRPGWHPARGIGDTGCNRLRVMGGGTGVRNDRRPPAGKVQGSQGEPRNGLLERYLRKRRQGYEDYIRRTSAFFPWFPKKRAS